MRKNKTFIYENGFLKKSVNNDKKTHIYISIYSEKSPHVYNVESATGKGMKCRKTNIQPAVFVYKEKTKNQFSDILNRQKQ